MLKNSSLYLIIINLVVTQIGIGQCILEIEPICCEVNSGECNFDYDFKLIKGKKLITDEIYPINHHTVSDLQKGKYKLKYKNIFDQEFEEEIEIDQRFQKIPICIDKYVRDQKTSIFNNLNQHDKVEITAYSTGCYYEDYGKIEVIKQLDFIELIFSKETNMKRKKVSKEDLEMLKSFEDKVLIISEIESMGYATTFYYEMKLNGKIKVKTNYSIDALGFNSMIGKIFE